MSEVDAQLFDRVRKAREMIEFVRGVTGGLDAQAFDRIRDILSGLLDFAKSDKFRDILEMVKKVAGLFGDSGSLSGIIDKILDLIGGIDTQSADTLVTAADVDQAAAELANEPNAQAFNVGAILAIVKVVFELIAAFKNRAVA